MARNVIEWEGAEAIEETGVGAITKVEPGERNVHVTINADHLREPVTGWADGEAMPFLKAHADDVVGRRVRYRIVVHRRRDVPADRPFDELGNREKVRDLVELTAPEDAPPGDDQQKRAQTPPNAPSTPPATDDASHPANGRPAQRSAPPSAPPADGPSAQQPRTPASEAKPWEARNTDGRLNLGSYAVMAAVGMVELALEQLVALGPDRAEDPAKVARLGSFLLHAADRVQLAVAHDGRVDRMATSHTRARGAIRSALLVKPVPVGAKQADVEAWLEDLVDYATAVLNAGIDLTEQALNGER